MRLIVAEKPIAAKRIAEILGEAKLLKKFGVECYKIDDSIIVPLKGHIENVDFPEEYKSWEHTDLNKLIDADLVYLPTQEDIIKALKEFAPKSDELIIACDYDREGESIGKEAVDIIKSLNPEIKVKRAKFSTLTSEEVKDAFSNLMDFDENLANSADTRREIDLIWGAVLTRYISLASGRLGRAFLSVGRVQTPTLALVVEREKERKAFVPEPYWYIYITCLKDSKEFRAEYEEKKLFDKEKADRIGSLKSDTAEIKNIEEKKRSIKPPHPFNTTGFIRAASNLGYQPRTAMSIAESLYMSGYISYPRTDNTVYPSSINLRKVLEKFKDSKEFGELAKKLLTKKKLIPTKGKKKTTDHPPIYPVEVADKKKLSKYEWRIYELVVRRFFSTLADNSEVETMRVDMDYGGEKFIARGEIILKKGWREFYIYSKVTEVILPDLDVSETINVKDIQKEDKKTEPKPHYSPAALIKEMEDLGLGTKSTRAEMLHKLVSREYLIGRQSFRPSHVALAVVGSLEQYAPRITKPEMTSKLEEQMDLVGQGKREKPEVVEDSRKMLHEVLGKLAGKEEKIGEDIREAHREDLIIGKCPKCDGNMRMIFMHKGTRFVGCSNYPKCDNSYPLPRMGMIHVVDKPCKECGLPMIRVIRKGKRPYEMCIDPKCPSKKDWGKRKKKKKSKTSK